MKSVLFVCNTYSQLIESIQLRITTFKDDSVSVIITDHTNNSKTVYNRIKKIDVFNNAYYFETLRKYKSPTGIISKFDRLKHYIWGSDPTWREYINDAYDELIFYSQTDEIYTLFSYLYKKNKNINASRYEEGIVSYDDWNFYSKKANIASRFRHLMKKASLEDRIKKFYCFYPMLYEGSLEPEKIPTIDPESRITEILKYIFEVDSNTTDYNQYKYIFFSSIYDIEHGKSIGEIDAVSSIAKYVGIDNLLVKVHPRDNPQRFRERGLHVDEKSSVPWEAIQIGNDFSNHVFLTTNSCSVLSISLIQKNKPKVLYVYPLCKISNNPVAAGTIKTIESLLNSEFVKTSIDTVRVIKDIEELNESKVYGE